MCFYLHADMHEGDHPSWEQIKEVIKSLEGKQTDNFYLEFDHGVAELYCGGGDLIDGERRYLVSYVSGGESWILINPEEPDDEKFYTITIQTPGEQPAH